MNKSPKCNQQTEPKQYKFESETYVFTKTWKLKTLQHLAISENK